MKDNNLLGTNVVQEWEVLKAGRDTLSNMFRDTAFYCMPEIYDYVKLNENRQQDAGSYATPADAIGSDMVNTLASALYSNTVSTGSRWCSLRASSERLNDIPEVADFYSKLTDAVLKALQNSNFSLMVHENLRHACTLGTGILGSQFSEKEGKLEFSTLRVSDCALAENASNLVDTIFFEVQLTPIQAIGKWGDGVPDIVKAKAKMTDGQAHVRESYIRCIKPRQQYDKESKLTKDMPYQDVVVCAEDKSVVYEGGHEDFPYGVHRFYHVQGTPYGRSPAMNALGSLRMLERILEDYVDGMELQLQPPVFIPSAVEQISLDPGAVNEYDPTSGGEPKWFTPGIDARGSMDLIQRYEQQIRDIFYADKFLAIAQNTDMTATEVVARTNEKIQSVSPVVARMHSEFMSGVIERVVRLVMAHGLGPAIPEALLQVEDEDGADGTTFQVTYTTRLDARLAEVDTDNFLVALQQVAALFQAVADTPQMAITVDMDKAITMIFQNNNVDPDLTRSKKEVQRLREAQAQAMAAERQAEMAARLVKPVDVSKAPEPGSPMESMDPAQLQPPQ